MENHPLILNLEEAAAWAREVKASGRTLAVTNGVFDLLHRGHVTYLSQAALEADELLVAMNSDSSVKMLKGPERPVVPQEDRAYLLASLKCVSAVTIFDGVRATEVFRAIAPDIYVKGGDYTEDSLDREEHAALKEAGAKFRFLPFIAGRSTTSVIRQIRGEVVSKASGDARIAPLLARRSVRKFQLRPVSQEDLRVLLEAAMAAPSACRKDPWHFYAITSPELKSAVAAVLPNGHFASEAPALVVLAGDISRAHGGELSYLLQDCAAAQENLLLASSMIGLGGCWLGVHPREERCKAIAGLLKLPENLIPVAAAALGWPAEHPAAETRYREEAVTFL